MEMFEIYQSENNQYYYFRLKAGNGEVILFSEGYTTKAACENGVASVQKNGQIKERYEQKSTPDGRYYFWLKAGNGQVIGSSQLYKSESGILNGILSVKKNSLTTEILDLTE